MKASSEKTSDQSCYRHITVAEVLQERRTLKYLPEYLPRHMNMKVRSATEYP